jgi:hypothetical protein
MGRAFPAKPMGLSVAYRSHTHAGFWIGMRVPTGAARRAA